MYADDLCFLAESPDGLQQLMSVFHQACCKFGLKVSINKTEVMALDTRGHETLAIQLGENVLKQVDKFRYLGNTITSKCDLDAEINTARSVLQLRHLASCVPRFSAPMTLN